MNRQDDGIEFSPILSSRGIRTLEDLHASPLSKTRFSVIRRLIDTLAGLAGLEVAFRVPKGFESYPIEAWEVVPYIQKMHSLGILDKLQFVSNLYPDEPQGFAARVTLQNPQKRIGYSGEGRDIFERKRTLWPTLGEALERWALSTYTPVLGDVQKSSYKGLEGNKIDLFKIVGFSAEMRKRGNAKYALQFNEDTEFVWTKGKSLPDSEDVWLPLQLVSFAHVNGMQESREPMLAPSISTGAATGQNLESAITSGLLEVIERDAYMVYWLNKISPTLIDIRSIPDPRFVRMLEIAKRYRLEIYLQYLETDMPVHTLGILVRDTTGFEPAAIISAGSGFDAIDVAYKLVSTSLVMRQSQRLFCEKRKEVKDLNPATLSHEGRILYYSKPEHFSALEFLIEGRVKTYEEVVRKKRRIVDNQKDLVRFLTEEKNYQVIYKDILPRKVSEALGGLRTVMVKVPEIQPLHLDETLPAFSGPRLKEVPVYLGITPREEVNPDPHPFP